MSIFDDDAPDHEPFRPQWLSPPDDQPFKLAIESQVDRPVTLYKLTTPRLAAGVLVDNYAAARATHTLGAMAVESLTGALKRKLVERYGLEAVLREAFRRKLTKAAHLEHDAHARHAILAFLASVDLLEQ